MSINGQCDSKFETVKAAFAKNFADGSELGASFAATVNGEFVVDIWAGDANESGRAWREDTIVNVYSTTKTMTALCALLLADRGELDLAAPVARYWPEFGAAGKKDIQVRHLLSHSAGLSGMDVQVAGDDLYDWDKMTGLLAAQAPWWEDRTQSGYHALTQGYLVGEVVRRITGQSLGKFFAAEIAGPLDADFHIGVDPALFSRVGDLVPPPTGNLGGDAPKDSIASRTFVSPVVNASDSRTRGWRMAEIPAGNGHGNARSVVRVQTLLACGGEAFGKRLMSPGGARRVFEQQTDGVDLVLGMPVKFGYGYGLNSAYMPLGPNPNTCFWGGWGGSLVVVDADARVCMSYVMNKMGTGTTGDARAGMMMAAVYGALAA